MTLPRSRVGFPFRILASERQREPKASGGRQPPDCAAGGLRSLRAVELTASAGDKGRAISWLTPAARLRASKRKSPCQVTCVDFVVVPPDNSSMSTDTSLSDLEIICKSLAEGTPIDPDLRQKALETARQLREELRTKHGTLNVAVNLVREVREE